MNAADVKKEQPDGDDSRTGSRGSSTVELSIIMPVILLIIVMLIRLLTGMISEARETGDTYCILYSTGWGDEIKQENLVLNDGCLSIKAGAENITYKTEFDKCSSRLRRWQLYGDILCE